MKTSYGTGGWIIFLMFFICSEAVGQFSGGEGTSENPWQVSSAADLDNIRNYPEAYFIQTQHINLDAAPWNEDGWEPVDGTFSGTYDGAGYAIRNLFIDRPSLTDTGLFRSIQGGVIRNVVLENVQITGGNRTGALAGQIGGSSEIENVHVSGELQSTSFSTGGLAGSVDRSSVHYSSAHVVIDGYSSVGGLIGSGSINVIVRHCWSDGSVRASHHIAGGLIGSYNGSSQSISDSYSHASVSAADQAGGFVGYMQTGHISRSFSTGPVQSDDKAGGFVAYVYTGNIYKSYWDINRSGQQESDGGDRVIGKTTEQMQQRETWEGYNFYTLWRINEGRGYPTFRNVSLLDPLVYDNTSDSRPITGSGTPDDPFQISNIDELALMRTDLEAFYILVNDLDMASSVSWNMGQGWKPIGQSDAFKGGFDGNGYTIRNLVVNRPVEGFVGFFGKLDGADVRNVVIERGDMLGASYTGILAGSFAGSSILSNSHVHGQVLSTGQYAGGLAGSSDRSTVHYTSADVWLECNNSGGGLIGSASINTAIRHSWSTGSVSTLLNRAGGLIGHYNGSNESITDSYSHVSVTGLSRIGGLIGYQQTGHLFRVFSTGLVEGSEHAGGLIGERYTGSAFHSYFDMDRSGHTTSAGGDHVIGLSTAEMQQKQTWKGFNFFTLWEISEGLGYPSLQDISVFEQMAPVSISDLSGSGTESAPYQISNVHELAAVAQDTETYYELVSDIDMSATVNWNMGEGWAPIPNFSGNFDGAGFEIHNLTINRPMEARIGLFGQSSEAELRDIHLRDASVLGRNDTGILVGSFNSGSLMEYCSATGDVVSSSMRVGGLVGTGDRSEMYHNYAVAHVWGSDSVGGLIGSASIDLRIHYAWSEGSVTGYQARTGGLVGHFNGSNRSIQHAYSLSEVTGDSRVGGFIGYHQTGTVQYAYSAGRVRGEEHVGGFIGERYAGSVFFGFWDMERSGQTEDQGGERVTGRTTEDMTWPYEENTFSGWDFTDVWAADRNEVNFGYPYLRELAPSLHEITVQSENAARGTVSGSGSYRHGATVSVFAHANEGWQFERWTEGGETVSYSSSYTFGAFANRNLTAVFVEYVSTSLEWDADVPQELMLSQNYPNPFNPVTQIRYAVPEASHVVLEVYSVTGQRVAVLVDSHQQAGWYTIQFDGSAFASGIYISRLRTGRDVRTKPMTLIK
ncbi:ZmpA/ZmpB/ZmpC family metallo-endopeptidase-related protein [Balneolaceae bacterium ANBcel3]|nr:ZmpA/ZmpB/ZmpC family metallo-endopeptidase-related protein [Balneolaceae bacterium ANBcel3]